jgi:serine/threonine protein kinase
MIEQKLGNGAFGEVFKVKDLKTKRIYAGKVEKIRLVGSFLSIEHRVMLKMHKKEGFPISFGIFKHENNRILLM